MENDVKFNEHNKKEYPPMHTCEHILNRTMVNMFACPRSKNTHIERKKSKCDYLLKEMPTEEQILAVESAVNEQIRRSLDVYDRVVSRDEAAELVDLSKLPGNASDMLRLVYVGDYDICACIGDHVANTSEIGKFKIISSDYNKEEGAELGVWRVRFKLLE